VDDIAEVLGGAAAGRLTALGIVLDEHLGAVASALCGHADVEPGVGQFAGGELP
jgi:hypothetical protein